MTTCSFDTLLVILQNAVIDVNASVRQRRLSLFPANDGEPAASEQSLCVQIPQGPAEDAACVPVTLPMSLFRDRRLPQIAMLSVEFDCSLHFPRLNGLAAPQLHLDIARPRFAWLSRRKLHHVRIVYQSSNAWQPQIEVNGRVMPLPSTAPAEGGLNHAPH